ncbi:MAG: hypothetical protein ABIG96_03615 [Candidatus Micrarchaeota archaeon]
MKEHMRLWLLAFYAVILLSFQPLDMPLSNFFSDHGIAAYGFYLLLVLSAGFFILLQCVQILIKALVAISRLFGISQFTTSFLVLGVAAVLPEFSISLNSAIEGNPAFGLGILLGSNVTDLTLILGVIAILSSGVSVAGVLAHRNFNYYLLLLALPLLLMLDGEYSRIDGALLLAGFVLNAMMMSSGKKSAAEVLNHIEHHKLQSGFQFLLIALSLIVLFSSANVVAGKAVLIASVLNVPSFFLGVLLAAATCLPELTFSLEAIREKRKELGLGDILGNVITDATLTLGVLALLFPFKIPEMILAVFTAVSMLIVGALAIHFLRTGRQLDRKEGLMLLLIYFVFLIAQIVLEGKAAIN